MDFITWARSPWGQAIPTHVAWGLIWVAVIAGFFFMIVHALYVAIVAPRRVVEKISPAEAAAVPERVPRHSLAARLFHWIMAISMLTLLITAFLPKVGVQFNWVLYHWIAGLLLTVSILFHIIHASFFWISGQSGRIGSTCATPYAGRCVFSASPRRQPRVLPSIRWRTSSIIW
jgi:hypothetical protein